MKKFLLSAVMLGALLLFAPVSYASTWVLVGDDGDGEVQYFLDVDSIVRQGDLLKLNTKAQINNPEKYNNISMTDSQMEMKIPTKEERTVRQVQYDVNDKIYPVMLTDEQNWKPIAAGTLSEAILNKIMEIQDAIEAAKKKQNTNEPVKPAADKPAGTAK